jgi:hypothetical protein
LHVVPAIPARNPGRTLFGCGAINAKNSLLLLDIAAPKTEFVALCMTRGQNA